MMKSKPIQNKILLFVGVVFFITVQSKAYADESNLIEASSGIYKKVIVKRDGVKLHSERDGGKTEPIESKAVQYKIKTPDQKESDNGWIRVGGSDGEPRGWLKEEDVIEWNTRFLARPNQPKQNSSFTIKSQDGNVYTYKGAGKGKAALCPILSEPKGDKNPVYNCALFIVKANDNQGAVAPKSPGGVDVPLDIVFVIDTTSSMTPLITAAKEVTKAAANRLLGESGEVRKSVNFGLVEYRDSTPEIAFEPGGKPAQVVTPLTDINTFQDKLAKLRVTPLPSGEDWNEDVLAGLKIALEDSNWAEKSSKHIILLGDAPHCEGDKNTTGWDIPTAVTTARSGKEAEGPKLRGNILFHAIMAKHAQGGAEDRVTEEQFRQLAQNGGRFEGVFMTFGGLPGSEQRVINDLGEKLSDAIGSIKGPLSAQSPSANTIAKAIWDIRVAEEGAPIPVVDSGTAKVRDADGNKLAELEVMVSKDALKRLASIMGLLVIEMKQMSDPAKRKDIGALLNALKRGVFISAAGQNMDANTPLDTLIKGLPLQTNVLKVTPTTLAQKNEESFNDWLKNLESTKTRADILIDRGKDSWHEITGAAANADYTYVALQDMP